jgi:hypothetical protein
MKNIKMFFICYLLLFSIQDISASKGNGSIGKLSNTTAVSKRNNIDALSLRRLEIKQMDKSALTNSEKKLLRKEDQAIKKEQVHGGGGIYLSLSAIVIVLLLLVILL